MTGVGTPLIHRDTASPLLVCCSNQMTRLGPSFSLCPQKKLLTIPPLLWCLDVHALSPGPARGLGLDFHNPIHGSRHGTLLPFDQLIVLVVLFTFDTNSILLVSGSSSSTSTSDDDNDNDGYIIMDNPCQSPHGYGSTGFMLTSYPNACVCPWIDLSSMD